MAVAEVSAKPTTPLEWVGYLEGRLNFETGRSDPFARAYDGEDTSLKFAQDKFTEVFGSMFHGWQDNFLRLIVDSISERLCIKGFRFGDTDEADKDAQNIFQYNDLDADSNAAHIDALVRGHSYLTVWGTEDGLPIIQPEPASQMVVQYRAGTRRVLDAALKRYFDDWGTEYSTLWTPKLVYKATKGISGWQMDDDGVRKNPLGVVPVVPLSNRSRLITTGKGWNATDCASLSELAPLMRLQEAINKVSADAIVASEFAAFPQRIITNLEFESESEEREAMMRAYIDRILAPEGDDVKWGQFEAADLSNYVRLIDMLVQHLASQSRVPFHYFLLNGGAAPSGDAVTAAEAGLVRKARERMLHFGEAWERAMRLAFLVLGDPRAKYYQAATIWDDPEHRSEAARTDSLLKQRELNIPDQVLQEKAGYSREEIARFPAMREQELNEQIERQKKLAAVTGAVGGSAPAGNGTSADKHTDATVARQAAAARAS